MSKEPGQLAFETWYAEYDMNGAQWTHVGDGLQKWWASMEAAIRADERKKTLEECCKAVCAHCSAGAGIVIRKVTSYPHDRFKHVYGDDNTERLYTCYAAGIRKQMEAEDGR